MFHNSLYHAFVCVWITEHVNCAEISDTTLFGKQKITKIFVVNANSAEANPNITI